MGLFILWKTSEICNLLLSRLYSLGWSIQHDKELKSNLRKSPKLSYLALHPGSNKQNVPLALKTTITAARSYFPNWRDVASFLEIFNTWWTISNSKQRFSPNILKNTVINGTKNWVFKSSGRLNWTNTKTASTLTTTLRAHAVFIDDLLRLISMWQLLDCRVIQLNHVSPCTDKWVGVGFLTICEKF